MSDLNNELKALARKGCYPSIYQRGPGLWRAHINSAGNFWEDASTPLKALKGAVSLWKKAGCPLDGMAAEAAGGRE